MRIGRSTRFASSLLLVAGLGLTGCQTVATGAEGDAANPPATVEEAADGGPAKLTVTPEAVTRLGLQTSPVTPQGSVPYAAVVYDAEGGTWTFVEQEPGVYQRQAITVLGIEGDVARLTQGPPAGTPVVTVGAAELVGVEAGISGGE